MEIGKAERERLGIAPPGAERALAATQRVLEERGYEPYRDDRGCVHLRSCPFHELAEQDRDLVCSLQRAAGRRHRSWTGQRHRWRRAGSDARRVLRQARATFSDQPVVDYAGCVMFTIQGMPNRSMHIPNSSPHICFSSGIITVPLPDKPSQ